MFSDLSVRIGTVFSKFRLSPNQWTAVSLLPVLVAVYFLSQGGFIVAGLLFLLSSFLDLVDGSVARVTGRVSILGAYLDTIVDRYVEAIIIFGLLLVSLPAFIIPSQGWLFLYFLGGLMTTYSKAAAKEKNLVKRELKGGLLERAERLIILTIGIFIAAYNPLYLTYVIAVLAFLTNLSAVQRISIAARSSRE